jgi:transposase-like protein
MIKDIRRAARRHYSAEDKIRILLEGLRGDDSTAELCRREGIAQSQYYVWSKEFMEAGIARRTFSRWYDKYLTDGPEALEDKPSRLSRVWNRLPPEMPDQIIEMALEYFELSPRELAVCFTEERHYFVSESTVYRLLKAHDLITSPAFIIITAANELKHKAERPNGN